MNSYIRFKLALTEDEPTIKGYMEDRWAELPEANRAPIEGVAGVARFPAPTLDAHAPPADRSGVEAHLPPSGFGPTTLDKSLALYSWHGQHHVAHITKLREE